MNSELLISCTKLLKLVQGSVQFSSPVQWSSPVSRDTPLPPSPFISTYTIRQYTGALHVYDQNNMGKGVQDAVQGSDCQPDMLVRHSQGI